MGELPTGTVTFLFTDIEGSTRLLDELGDGYAELLAEHHRLMRGAFEPNGGVEVDTQGDAFFVAFERTPDAVAAAATAQEALTRAGLKVRMGIHTGQPLLTETGYVGMDVHRAARIMSAGHGGQVVLSDESRSLLDGSGLLSDLGLHRLKDLTEPQRLWQLGNGEFPPLKTLYQTNLPVQPTPLVGREAELAEVLHLIESSRLVTLTGAGGSGKTRLALHAAAELVDDFKDGVWWVSLAALRDPELVQPTLAQVVGAKEGLAEHLRAKQTLLLLDNFEQLLEAAPLIAGLLAEAPDLRVLATSRERLGIAAEQEYAVPTMVPTEALALFTARARQLKPDFQPDDAVSEICVQLDGLPLAIELAAARIKVLRPDQILERLGHSLDLLTTGARDAPERHQTLRATIEWSYELLDDAERELFARLAVFAGSFDLEAAKAVSDADLDAVAALVDKSLLRQAEEGRFFLLETIREYGVDRLDAEDRRRTEERHARWFAAAAESWREEGVDSRHAEVLVRFDLEIENLRASFDWLAKAEEGEEVARLAVPMFYYLDVRGHIQEASDMLTRAVELTRDLSDARRAKVLSAASSIALVRGDYDAAAELAEDSAGVASALGDDRALADAATVRGNLALAQLDLTTARAAYLAAEAHARKLGDVSYIATAQGNLGIAAALEEDYDEAIRLMQSAEATFRLEENRWGLVNALVYLAYACSQAGRYEPAADAARESLALAVEIDYQPAMLHGLHGLGVATAGLGDHDRATTLLGAADALREELGISFDAFETRVHETAIETITSQVRDERFEAQWKLGRGMTSEQAVEYASS